MSRSSQPMFVEEPHKDWSNLDLLRACAIIAIFVGQLLRFHGVDHLGPLSLANLYVWGIVIFFVHSGLVLMLSLERQWCEQGPANLFTDFMTRRFFRVLPLSAVLVSLVVIFGLPLMAMDAHHFYRAILSPSVVVFDLLLISNLTKSVSVLSPAGWVTSQLQMCLLLPWIFVFLRPARSIWRFVILYVAAIALALAGLYAGGIGTLLRAVPLYLAGVLGYHLYRNKVSRLPAFLWPPLLAVLTLLFLEQNHVRLLNGPQIGECGVYAMGLILGLLIPRFAQISNRWLVTTTHTIAKYSYGIFLTHVFTIWLAMDVMSHLPMVYRVGTLVVVGAGLPILFYHGLEAPMTAFGKQLVDRHVRSKVLWGTRTTVSAPEQLYEPVRFRQSRRAAENES
jgi:peptidoglycan/LPS O-acetylase OafA/YrhL